MLDLPTPTPTPSNEPILSYAPGTPERAALKSALTNMAKERPDVPHVIAGKESREGDVYEVRAPHDHALHLANCHEGSSVTPRAIEAAMAAAPAWAATPYEERARVFSRAAELLAGPWRQ